MNTYHNLELFLNMMLFFAEYVFKLVSKHHNFQKGSKAVIFKDTFKHITMHSFVNLKKKRTNVPLYSQ